MRTVSRFQEKWPNKERSWPIRQAELVALGDNGYNSADTVASTAKILTPVSRWKLIASCETVKICALQILVSLAVAYGVIDAEQTRAAAAPGKSAFTFRGVGYLHRWSMNGQHEFTPEGQEDLQKWSDMITMNVYPDAHDGDALAAKANAVLENYKNHKGTVLKTNSVPRTSGWPAEHFVAVVFGRPNFIEVAFARFKLVNGVGCSIVYSHRIYGEKIDDQMSAWLNSNGPDMEKALMEWNAMPSPASSTMTCPAKELSRVTRKHQMSSPICSPDPL